MSRLAVVCFGLIIKIWLAFTYRWLSKPHKEMKMMIHRWCTWSEARGRAPGDSLKGMGRGSWARDRKGEAREVGWGQTKSVLCIQSIENSRKRESGGARRPRGADQAASFGLVHKDPGPTIECESWSNQLPSLGLSFLIYKMQGLA